MGSRLVLHFGLALAWCVVGLAGVALVFGVVALPFLVWKLEFGEAVRVLVFIWGDSALLLCAAMTRDAIVDRLGRAAHDAAVGRAW